MNIIKLDAIDSTNSFLRSLLSEGPVKDLTVVVAKKQLQGRGQRGSSWMSEPEKNLTFSVYKAFPDLAVKDQFRITMAVSLALLQSLRSFGIPDLHVKWPNDILSGNAKLAGILIENIIQDRRQHAVIGVGLNVNQKVFRDLPNAASMSSLCGKAFDLDEVLSSLCNELEKQLKLIDRESLQEAYESALFRKDKPSTFRLESGELLMGFIRGVDDNGLLILELEDQLRAKFAMKELSLLY